jgi:hypothetical protein
MPLDELLTDYYSVANEDRNCWIQARILQECIFSDQGNTKIYRGNLLSGNDTFCVLLKQKDIGHYTGNYSYTDGYLK